MGPTRKIVLFKISPRRHNSSSWLSGGVQESEGKGQKEGEKSSRSLKEILARVARHHDSRVVKRVSEKEERKQSGDATTTSGSLTPDKMSEALEKRDEERKRKVR